MTRCTCATCTAERTAQQAREEADAALLAMARCIPPRALAEMARVFAYGGEKHGAKACESGGGQTVEDHAEHAEHHLRRSYRGGGPIGLTRDRDTGALDLIHTACRAALAAELVLAGEETGK